MDDIAAGIVDKFSMIDFFNVLISGGVFIYGLSLILNDYVPAYLYNKITLAGNIEKGIITFILCYLSGGVIQMAKIYFFDIYRSMVTSKCLAKIDNKKHLFKINSVLDNNYKRDVYIKLALRLFHNKQLGRFNPSDTKMCQYFFAYCEYYNTLRGNNAKTEKMREVSSLCEQIAIAFYSLTLIALLYYIINKSEYYWLFFFIIGTVFVERARISRINWAKMVMATYEVGVDRENNR